MRSRELWWVPLRSTVSFRRSCSVAFHASAGDTFPGPPFRGGSSACWGVSGFRSGFCGEASDAPRASGVRRELCRHAQRSFPLSARGGGSLAIVAGGSTQGSARPFRNGRLSRRHSGFSHHSAAKNQQRKTANNGAAENCSARHGSCYSDSGVSRSVVALSHVRCRSLRATFAATAPRSAVSELGVVSRLRIAPTRRPTKDIPITDANFNSKTDNIESHTFTR